MSEQPEPAVAAAPAGATVRRRRGRFAGVKAALATSLIFAALAWLDRRHGFWLLAGAGVSITLAAVLFRDRLYRRVPVTTRLRSRSAMPSVGELLAAIPDPAIVLDRRAVVRGATLSAHAAFPTLRVGQPVSFALRAPEVLDGVDLVLRKGTGGRLVSFSQRGAIERFYEVTITPFEGEGADLGALLFFRDETAARRLEMMRVDFVANASHELRTPLASVMGFIETLQGPARNDPVARERFLGIMREQSQRMARLIDDLLSLSRIEMHAHVQPDTPVDVLSLVAHIIDTLTPLAEERGVEIRFSGPEGELIVPGARDELLRVFENLIENAVKYGQSGGLVEVSVTAPPEAEAVPADAVQARQTGVGATVAASGQAEREVVISVRDHGPGIAPEHLPRLTERFYRVDVAESRDKGGTGLGLAIVKHIITHHRGRLHIESVEGEGALFRVSLPVFGVQQGAGRR